MIDRESTLSRIAIGRPDHRKDSGRFTFPAANRLRILRAAVSATMT
jgi:hypothetical protein